MFKEFKYIYLFRRTDHRTARLILKKKMWNAAKVERQLHRYFAKSRFKMTTKIWKGKWFQEHIKIGISKNVSQRLLSVNSNVFKSGKTEWFAMNIFELVFVYLWILWYAYRWFILAGIIGLLWLSQQGGSEIPVYEVM